MAATNKVLGYLPNDTPPFGKMVLLGLQHVLTMFPATVLCAILMHFNVSTVLTVTGFGTIIALIGSKLSMGKFIPLYYGSSFSYIAAVLAVESSLAKEFGWNMQGDAPAQIISIVQAGFVATGIINIVVGLIIRLAGGKSAIDKVLPPIITGSVACTIGIGLGFSALSMASGAGNVGAFPDGSLTWWAAAMVTMMAAVLFSVYLQGKGFIGLLPILLGAIVGYIVAWPLGLLDPSKIFVSAGFLGVPQITLPNFTHPASLSIMISVGIMCIATIPESTAHLYQISLYVDHLAEEQGREGYGLSKYIGLNLMLDGLDDLINGIFGSTAGTNYGENNSLMVITRNYSGPSLITAGVIAVILGFVLPLRDIVNSIPTAVSGGLMIYLFGVIGMQGIALMISEKVNLYDPRQLAIGAIILIVGIGGNIGFPNGLPIPLLNDLFHGGWPAIATAAIMGIILNLIFIAFKPAFERGSVEKKPEVAKAK
jgi:uracil permease